MGNESGQFLCLYQNSTRMLYVTIRENTFWIMFKMMIQSMDKSECTKTFNGRRHKAKPGTNTNARFLILQVLSRELPKERANQVVEQFISAIDTPENARPSHRLVHTTGCRPASNYGFQPTHSNKCIDMTKAFKQILEPIHTHIDVIGYHRPKGNDSLVGNT